VWGAYNDFCSSGEDAVVAAESVAVRRVVLADLVPGAVVRNALLVLGGAGLAGLAAQVSIPLGFTPVPLSLQTFAVLLVGAALGPWRGLASMALYLVAGLVGVPWFAGGTHGAAFASFGYIIGFVAAAGVVGELARRRGDRTPLRTAGTMVVGNIVVYAFGVAWLAALYDMSLPKALAVGVLPFLIGDAIKIVAAAGVLPGTWALVRRFSGR
jgi:biotin transport system substrate-specific component